MHVKKYGSWNNWDPTLRDMLGSIHALLSLSLVFAYCIWQKKSIALCYTTHIKSIENVPEKIQLPFMVKHIYTENSWQPPNLQIIDRLQELAVAKERRKVCSIFWRIGKIAKSN